MGLQTGLCGVNDVTISGGVTTIANVGYGITANAGLFALSGGQVNVSALEYAVLANDSGMTFSGGCLTAGGGSSALFTSGSITNHMASYFYRTNTNASAPETAYTFFPDTEFVYDESYKYVELNYCPDVYVSGDNADPDLIKVSGVAESYWLNDGSGSITASEASADNYNVKYDSITQTLTLRDAEITQYHRSEHGEKYVIPR